MSRKEYAPMRLVRAMGGAFRGERHLINVLLLAALVLATFGRSLDYGFVWDDTGLIVNNPHVKSSEGVRQLLGQSFWAIGPNVEDSTRSFYRPLVSLSYALDYMLWELDPAGYHLTNLLWHTVATLTAYLLAMLLLRRPTGALAAAALFAVHPTRVESVCWISGRTDVLCGAFYFVSMAAFVSMFRDRRREAALLTLSVLAYAAALLCKETAITLPIVAIAAYRLLGKRGADPDRRDVAWGLFALVTVAYLLVRMRVLGRAVAPAVWGTIGERISSVPMVFAAYLGSLLSLVPVDPHHSTAFAECGSDPRLFAGVVVSVLYAAAFAYVLRRGWRTAAFLTAWVPVTLLPMFKLGSFGDILHADRFLYIPSLGFTCSLVVAGRALISFRGGQFRRVVHPAAVVAGLVLVTAWGAVSSVYSGTWRDNVTLFRRAALNSPESAYVLTNLGSSYAAVGDHERAIAAYLKACDADPAYTDAFVNMGISWEAMGQRENARRWYMRAVELGARGPVAFSKMGGLCRASGRIDEAIAWYRRSLAARVTSSAHNNLGECLLAKGMPEEAEKHFLAALEVDRGPAACNNLARIAIMREEYEKADGFLVQALALAGRGGLSSDVEIAVYYNFAKCSVARGDTNAAIRYARKVLTLARRNADLGARYVNDPWLRTLAGEY